MNLPISDYSKVYGKVMDFNLNKAERVHRWFPFVEGYSVEFINSVLSEQETDNIVCLDPFCGSGTTPLEMQIRNIECYSIEVNPFLHLLSTVKMNNTYSRDALCKELDKLNNLSRDELCRIPPTLDLLAEKKFIVDNGVVNKWNFDIDTFLAFTDLHKSINTLIEQPYRDLFNIVYASLLVPLSNLYRNGKCLSYKTNWKDKQKTSYQDVYTAFLTHVQDNIIPDVVEIEHERHHRTTITNKERCFLGDSRYLLDKTVPNQSVNLVITSPPYLNSRDYTDIYILELWMLGLAKAQQDITTLRRKTLRSHVQVNWGESENLHVSALSSVIKQIELHRSNFWNPNLIEMIQGYFVDIRDLLQKMKSKLTGRSKVYLNIANSAYYGNVIHVDEICAELAEREGFRCTDIRTARWLKSSGQQKLSVSKLKESVIVLEYNK
ncbi:MAG: hypothetical protein PHY48_07245 [Candidatus Cloacimonetes bacterium]|nr:hypothetical protein [Candidatus Cloacimonadota bacterium]